MPTLVGHKTGLSYMRLTKYEVQAIITGVYKFALPEATELRLFGSRVDDQAKGGDIDLLLIANNSTTKAFLLENKLNMLIATKNILGEQKIDLKIASLEELHNDPFLQLIYPRSILLANSLS